MFDFEDRFFKRFNDNNNSRFTSPLFDMFSMKMDNPFNIRRTNNSNNNNNNNYYYYPNTSRTNYQNNNYYNDFFDEINNTHNNNNDVDQETINNLCPDVDNMTYEELLALEEKMGNVKKGFSDKEKYNLPVVVYSKKWFKNQDNCIICLNDFKEKEKVMKLGCDHIFHVDCLNDWLENNKQCPLCKKDIKICYTVNDMYK